MKAIYQQSIREARKYLDKITDPVHGVDHAKSVFEYSKMIAENCTGFDKDLLGAAAWWHDVGRLYDEDHALLSAKKAKDSILKLGGNKKIAEKLFDVIISHRDAKRADSIEAKILLDADKIDLVNKNRWQTAINAKRGDLIELAIERLPYIKNKMLRLKQSKEIYNKAAKEFIDFVESNEDDFFKNYRKRILDLKDQL